MTVPLTPTQIKQARRAAKEAALAAKQLALPDRRYGVVVADPPWRWEPYSRETGMDRTADNHYSTSGVEAIAALPVSNIAADDCVLFLCPPRLDLHRCSRADRCQFVLTAR
jgi:hypothetical protein